MKHKVLANKVINAENGKIFKFKDVESACFLYKRYKGVPHDLMKNEPNVWNEYCKVASNPYTSKGYDWWLFDYCFGDVTK